MTYQTSFHLCSLPLWSAADRLRYPLMASICPVGWQSITAFGCSCRVEIDDLRCHCIVERNIQMIKVTKGHYAPCCVYNRCDQSDPYWTRNVLNKNIIPHYVNKLSCAVFVKRVRRSCVVACDQWVLLMSTVISDVVEDVMSARTSSNWPFVLNLANSIIGVAVLALPFCFREVFPLFLLVFLIRYTAAVSLKLLLFLLYVIYLCPPPPKWANCVRCSDGVKDTSLKAKGSTLKAEAKDSTLKAKTKDFKIVLEDPRGRGLVLEDSNTCKHRIKCFGEVPSTLHIYSVTVTFPLKSFVQNMQWLVKSVSSSFFNDLSHEAKDSTRKAKTKDFKIVLEDPRGRVLVLEDSNTGQVVC